MESPKKSGRPKKYKNAPVSFGMKLTVEDKLKIKQLAAIKEKPANEAIMELVNKELVDIGMVPKKRKVTAEDLLKMPKSERNQIIQAQVSKNLKNFEIIKDSQEILDY
jgi:hypothetical protein